MSRRSLLDGYLSLRVILVLAALALWLCASGRAYAQTYNATIDSPTSNVTQLTAGQQNIALTVTVHNTTANNLPWPSGSSACHLSVADGNGNTSFWNVSGNGIPQTTVVASPGDYTFSASIAAPTAAGSYYIVMQMATDAGVLFGSALTIGVQVSAAADNGTTVQVVTTNNVYVYSARAGVTLKATAYDSGNNVITPDSTRFSWVIKYSDGSVPSGANAPTLSNGSQYGGAQYSIPFPGTYKVTATLLDGYGTHSGTSQSISVTVSAPLGVTATAHPGYIDVKWNPAAATSYNLTRYCTINGTSYTFEQDGLSLAGNTLTNEGSNLSYWDRNVVPGVQYTYYIRSVYNGDTSSVGQAATATALGPTQDIALTAAGQIVQTSAGPVSQIVFTNGTLPYANINCWLVKWQGSGTHSPLENPTTTGFAPDTSVTGGQTYSYQISCENAVGIITDVSKVVTVTAPTPTAPAPKFSLGGGTYLGPQTLKLTDILLNANIYYTVTTPAGTSASTLYTLATTIAINQSETVTAVAKASGFTDSAPASATYTLKVPPPTITTNGTPGPRQVTLADTISPTPLGFAIYYTTDGVTTPTTASTVYMSPFNATATEKVQAIAVATGWTSSSVASATITVVPPAPTLVSVTANANGTSADFVWSGVTAGATVKAYGGPSSPYPFPASSQNYPNLLPGSTYSFKITQTVNGTQSPSSSAIPVTLLPTAPQIASITPGNRSIVLKWGAVHGAASYDIYRGSQIGSTGIAVAATPYRTGYTSTTLTNTSLSTGVTYAYTVSAVNAAGQSPQSAPIVSAMPTGQIATPTNIKAVAIGGNHIRVTFTAPAGATSYKVYRAGPLASNAATPARPYGFHGGGGGSTQLATTTTFTDGSLSPGRKYWYYVQAFGPDPSLPSALSSTASAVDQGSTGNAATVTDYTIGNAVANGSTPVPLVAGQTYPVSVTLLNTGTTTWTDAADVLASFVPATPPSGTVATSWSAIPPAGLKMVAGTSVSPGDPCTFEFSIKAPSTPTTGTNALTCDWEMKDSSTGAFAAVATAAVTVAAVNDSATPVSVAVLSPMVVNQVSEATVTMKNTGNTTWTPSSYSLVSVSSAPTTANPAPVDAWLLPASVGMAPGSTVAPQTNYTFTFKVTAPSTPGKGLPFYWQMNDSASPTPRFLSATTSKVDVYALPKALNLVAVPGNVKVVLTWTGVTGASLYNIYESQGSDPVVASGTPIATSTTASTTVTLAPNRTGMQNGTTYNFVVVAVNAAGTGIPSNPASATPTGSADFDLVPHAAEFAAVPGYGFQEALVGQAVNGYVNSGGVTIAYAYAVNDAAPSAHLTGWRVLVSPTKLVFSASAPNPSASVTIVPPKGTPSGKYDVFLSDSVHTGQLVKYIVHVGQGSPRAPHPGCGPGNYNCPADDKGLDQLSGDPYYANVDLTTIDPVATRGYPLTCNIHVGSQTKELNRPMGNATFTYDIHVAKASSYGYSLDAATGDYMPVSALDWFVVDGDGTRLDFGPVSDIVTPESPALASPHAYSSFAVHTSGTATTGYTLSNAGPPEDVKSYGGFKYDFDATGLLLKITDPLGNTQSLQHTGSLPTKVTDDATGEFISFAPNSANPPMIASVSSGKGLAVTQLAYTNGLLTNLSVQNNQAAEQTSVQYWYNADNSISAVQKDNDASKAHTFDYVQVASSDPGVPMLPVALDCKDANHNATAVSTFGNAPSTDISGVADTVRQTNPYGGVTTDDYDVAGNLLRERLHDPSNATPDIVTAYTYYPGTREVETATDSHGTTTYTYDNGRIATVTDGNGHVWTTTYTTATSTSASKVSSVYDSVSGSTPPLDLWTYGDTAPSTSPAHSLPNFAASYTDANSHTWTFAPETATLTGGAVKAYGQVKTIAPPAGSATGAVSMAYDETTAYGTLGYLKAAADALGDETTVNAYDSLGDPTSVTTYTVPYASTVAYAGSTGVMPLAKSSTATVHTTNIAYDAAQRVTSITHPDNQTFTNVYTANGQKLDHTTDEAGIQYFYSWCSCGLPVGETGPLGWSLAVTLSPDHQVTSFTDPNGNATKYNYNGAGLLASVLYPDAPQDPAYPNDPTKKIPSASYKYDASGLLATETNGRGYQTSYAYDNGERLTGVTYTTTGNPGTAYGYNDDDTLHTATDAVGTTTYHYLPDKSVDWVTYDYTASGLAAVQKLSYTYWPDGPLHTMSWQSGGATIETWTYLYDLAGRLRSVSNSFDGVNTAESTSYTYDGEGKLKTQLNSNHTMTAYGYNELRGWPTSITETKNVTWSGTTVTSTGTPFAKYALGYDDASSPQHVGLLTRVDQLDGLTVRYGYDQLYRLTRYNYGTPTTPGTDAVIPYDTAGNAYTGLFDFDSANKLVDTNALVGTNGQQSPDLYAYDLDGNLGFGLLQYGDYIWTGDWTEDDKLTDITESSTDPAGVSYAAHFGYGEDGLRRWESADAVNGGAKTFFVYSGDTLIGEVNADGTLKASYTQGAAGLISEHFPAVGTTTAARSLWYAFGPQGETRNLTDASGTVQDSYAYYPYGVPIGSATTGSDPNPFRYGGSVGYYTDSYGFGLVLCGQRWYAPSMARWISRDPAGYAGGANLYAYCGDNPVGLLDPDGTDPSAALLAANVVVTGIGAVPGLGAVAALGGAILSGVQGDGVGVGLSLLELVPGGGDVAAVAKEARLAKMLGKLGTAKRICKAGRTGKQAKLRSLLNDTKASSTDRGWIKQELNSLARKQRRNIRVPPGKVLAHLRGKRAKDGFGYSHSALQNPDLHRLEHEIGGYK